MAIDSINSSGSPLLPKSGEGVGAGSAAALGKDGKQTAAMGAKEAPASLDKASFSAAASALSSARSEAPVDLKKVESIRAQIQSGTYQVNSQKIAGKLLQEAVDFAPPRK